MLGFVATDARDRRGAARATRARGRRRVVQRRHRRRRHVDQRQLRDRRDGPRGHAADHVDATDPRLALHSRRDRGGRGRARAGDRPRRRGRDQVHRRSASKAAATSTSAAASRSRSRIRRSSRPRSSRRDPNLGRILVRHRQRGASPISTRRACRSGSTTCWSSTTAAARPSYTEEDGQRVMKQSEITVRVDLGRGVRARPSGPAISRTST